MRDVAGRGPQQPPRRIHTQGKYRPGGAGVFAAIGGDDDALAHAADKKTARLRIVRDVLRKKVTRWQAKRDGCARNGLLVGGDAFDDPLELRCRAQGREIIVGSDVVDETHRGPVAEGGEGSFRVAEHSFRSGQVISNSRIAWNERPQ